MIVARHCSCRSVRRNIFRRRRRNRIKRALGKTRTSKLERKGKTTCNTGGSSNDSHIFRADLREPSIGKPSFNTCHDEQPGGHQRLSEREQEIVPQMKSRVTHRKGHAARKNFAVLVLARPPASNSRPVAPHRRVAADCCCVDPRRCRME